MSNQHNRLLRLRTTTPPKWIDVDLTYIKGRGYQLVARDIDVKDGYVSFLLRFDGVGRRMVEEAPRFNRKRLALLSDLHTRSATCQELIREVCEARGLELVPQSEKDAAFAAQGVYCGPY